MTEPEARQVFEASSRGSPRRSHPRDRTRLAGGDRPCSTNRPNGLPGEGVAAESLRVSGRGLDPSHNPRGSASAHCCSSHWYDRAKAGAGTRWRGRGHSLGRGREARPAHFRECLSDHDSSVAPRVPDRKAPRNRPARTTTGLLVVSILGESSDGGVPARDECLAVAEAIARSKFLCPCDPGAIRFRSYFGAAAWRLSNGWVRSRAKTKS